MNTGAVGAGPTGTGGSAGSLASSSGGTKSAPRNPPGESNESGGCAISSRGRATPFGFAGLLGLGIWLARRRRR
jgi:MYXO-CTERM domain-containing protein